MKVIVFISFLVLLFSSCGSEKNSDTNPEEINKDSVVAKVDSSQHGLKVQIRQLEDTLFAAQVLDKKLGSKAIELYQRYHKYYWQDTMCADYLFKAGEIADNMGFPQKAIELYRSSLESYPTSSLAPYCLFRIGNIYQFTLSDYVEAKIAYNDCKKEYPNSPITKDAINLLNNVAKSDVEMVREFEKKNKRK
ncbi:MAG: tetratricopeptide repeat protein [Bacteroidota bacterium]|nr:tetratricopeptide repeat protein [Bacteroidota bacterium]